MLFRSAVMVEADIKYPDQIDDVVNRASTLFVTGLMAAKNQDIDITQPTLNESLPIDFDDLDED